MSLRHRVPKPGSEAESVASESAGAQSSEARPRRVPTALPKIAAPRSLKKRRPIPARVVGQGQSRGLGRELNKAKPKPATKPPASRKVARPARSHKRASSPRPAKKIAKQGHKKSVAKGKGKAKGKAGKFAAVARPSKAGGRAALVDKAEDETSGDEREPGPNGEIPIPCSKNASGYKGVYKARNGRWQAQANHMSVGGFSSKWHAGVAVAIALGERPPLALAYVPTSR